MADQDTSSAAATPTPDGPQSSRINPKWWIKMAIFTFVLLGLGVWGYYDASIAYPTRGHQASMGVERDYLKSIESSNPLDFNKAASVENPAATLAELAPRKSATPPLNGMEQSRLAWLESLAAVGKLDRANTTYPRDAYYAPKETKARITDARERLKELDAYEKSEMKGGFPKPLSSLDIPTQWLITIVGAVGGLWLLIHIVRVAGRKYRWDPAQQRLTLPGGGSITPNDIEEFDKRKWDKFLITLKIRADHPELAGKSITIDLLHHVLVEQWVLEMEKTAFPDSETEAG
jgi:hypothetical protein